MLDDDLKCINFAQQYKDKAEFKANLSLPEKVKEVFVNGFFSVCPLHHDADFSYIAQNEYVSLLRSLHCLKLNREQKKAAIKAIYRCKGSDLWGDDPTYQALCEKPRKSFWKWLFRR